MIQFNPCSPVWLDSGDNGQRRHHHHQEGEGEGHQDKGIEGQRKVASEKSTEILQPYPLPGLVIGHAKGCIECQIQGESV
jgi:hypothetical protein